MIAESASRETSRAESVDGQSPAAPRRQLLATPPLAPDLPRTSPEGLPFVTVVASLVLAGLSHLTGAPIFITLGLLATGLAGLAMHLRSRRTVHRATALL